MKPRLKDLLLLAIKNGCDKIEFVKILNSSEHVLKIINQNDSKKYLEIEPDQEDENLCLYVLNVSNVENIETEDRITRIGDVLAHIKNDTYGVHFVASGDKNEISLWITLTKLPLENEEINIGYYKGSLQLYLGDTNFIGSKKIKITDTLGILEEARKMIQEYQENITAKDIYLSDIWIKST